MIIIIMVVRLPVWESRHLTNLRASTTCYSKSFNFFLYSCAVRPLPLDHSAAERISRIEKSINLIANRTRDYPAWSTAPEPTMLPLICYR
jgi:hypothetical protein